MGHFRGVDKLLECCETKCSELKNYIYSRHVQGILTLGGTGVFRKFFLGGIEGV